MPRPKKDGAPEPKRRSRNGCWPCKARKIKCGEERPSCDNCVRLGDKCDYSIRLNWGGRPKKKGDAATAGVGAGAGSGGAATATTSTTTFAPATTTLVSPIQNLSFVSPSLETNTPSIPLTTTSSSSSSAAVASSSSSSSLPNSAVSPTTPALAGLGISSLHPLEHNGHAPATSGAQMPPPLSQWHVTQPSEYTVPPGRRQKRRKTGSSAGSVVSPTSHISQLHSMPMTPDSPPASAAAPASSSVTAPSQLSLGASPTAAATMTTTTAAITTTPTAAAKATTTSPDVRAAQAAVMQHVTTVNSSPKTTPTPTQSVRRLSVRSLLSDDIPANHGFDQGRPDVDIPRNDDDSALHVFSPSSKLSRLNMASAFTPPEGEYFGEFGFGLNAVGDTRFQLDEYYSEPVAVQIPRALEPLPELLHENPMNLLYFHHFLNHTARILVPHDCPDNPFRTILPAMACSDRNLLHLMLAYSASHRARLLQHPEPHNRIARYMEGVFPSLQEALFGVSSANRAVTDANLATAIMLASLEIISPNAFEVPVTWQTHLQIAWQMIAARGGYRRLLHSTPVAYFLARWFAYLDVVGSLSGSGHQRDGSHLGTYAVTDADPTNDATIDCLLGFRSSAIALLAHVADLAMRCDAERIAADGSLVPDWRPPAAVEHEAYTLEAHLMHAEPMTHKRCGHHAATPLAPADVAEALAIDSAYHLAGRIHLYCRVLALPREDGRVQDCVSAVVNAVGDIRAKGSAEACMLLPLFTAGCEAIEPAHRKVIRDRVAGVELSGMSQVHKASGLLERVWSGGARWETLVRGEFLG